jgi:caffeoyl-CoA O-methyltransferase
LGLRAYAAVMADAPKSFFLSPEIHQYLIEHGTPPDAVQQALIEETSKLGGIAMMQIAPEQGAFMTVLTKLVGARNAVEVGTFTGYSALCIARGLPDDGTLICCDVSEEWTSVGRKYWEQAGVADRIDLRIAPALETLRALPTPATIDLVFVDADKPNYAAYYEELLPRVRPNGLILVDNVLWGGSVITDDPKDENRTAIRAFNDMVAADDRVESVMLPLGDGLTLLRKR